MIKWAFIFCFACCAVLGSAQLPMPIIKSIPIAARTIEVDELGNVYVLRSDNLLLKYNERGDSLANYNALANGPMTSIDVSNPLRIMLYYARYAQLVLLDRMLAPKTELNVRKLNMLNANVIAASAEGNLWIYDQFNATLNKLDMELNYMIKGNDLRQQLSVLPKPLALLERNRRVYLLDTAQGIFIFDQYGSYLNTIPIVGLTHLQVIANQLVYRADNELIVYDMERVTERRLALPQLPGLPIQAALLSRNTLYVLYPDRLILYQLPN